MKLPHKVCILAGVYYDVVYVDRFDDPLQYGECSRSLDTHTRLIKIKAGMSPQKTRQAFWHELLHAFEFEYDIKIPHKLVYSLEIVLEKFARMNGISKLTPPILTLVQGTAARTCKKRQRTKKVRLK